MLNLRRVIAMPRKREYRLHQKSFQSIPAYGTLRLKK